MSHPALPRPFPRQPVIGRPALRGSTTTLPALTDLPHTYTQSGRAAIVLALQTLGLKQGDQVLVPTYHCPTMISPIEYLGATPLFYPICASGEPAYAWVADLDWSRIKAMLVAHFFGRMLDLRPFAALCRYHDAALIEDCAHAFYGSTAGLPIGSIGDFAIGSLPKFFPVATGGVLASVRRISDVPARPFAPLINELRAAWRALDLAAAAGSIGVSGRLMLKADLVRGKLRSIDAAIRCTPNSTTDDAIRRRALEDPLLPPASLTKFDGYLVSRENAASSIAARQHHFASIASLLTNCPGARPLFTACDAGSAPYAVPILVDDADVAYLRMREANLPVFRWDQRWPGTPEIPGDASIIWSHGVVQIACHQSFTNEDIEHLVQSLRTCLITSVEEPTLR